MAHVQPIIIAHRGSSGYLPEHTLPAKAMAHAQGADFLEQDVVLSREGIPVVLHDIYLDAVSDVARKFPGRAREDGKHYVIDFTLEELRTLRLSERFHPNTGQPVFPGRFPPHVGDFHIVTLAEEIEFLQGLNRSTGRAAGIYPEIKDPAFHHAQGQDLARIVLEVLSDFGYTEADDPVYVQCFDAAELRRVRDGFHSRLKLVQLVYQEEWLKETATAAEQKQACRDIAAYAQGLGCPYASLFAAQRQGESLPIRPLLSAAHEAGLAVHPWTYRADAVKPPFASFKEVHTLSLQAGVDGLFSDFPDQSRSYLDESASG